MRLGWLLGLLLACSAPGVQQSATPLPRFRGPLDSTEARWVTGMNYDPSDAPLLWRDPDTLLVAHVELYTMADVGGATCGGSGFFAVPVTPGMARVISVGRPACNAAYRAGWPAVDPTGHWVVFSARTEPNNSALVRFELATGRVDTLRTGCAIYADEPAWSYDGRAIAFRGLCESRDQDEWALYVIHADGTGLRTLPGESGYSAESPSWSPDGRRLAYVRSRMTDSSYSAEIAIVDSDGGGRRVLASGDAPAWSPDGKWIAYVAHRAGDLRDAEVHLIRPDGSGDRLLVRSHDRSMFRRGWGPIREGLPGGPLVWSPDGTWLAFARGFDRSTSVWRVNVETGDVRQVTRRE